MEEETSFPNSYHGAAGQNHSPISVGSIDGWNLSLPCSGWLLEPRNGSVPGGGMSSIQACVVFCFLPGCLNGCAGLCYSAVSLLTPQYLQLPYFTVHLSLHCDSNLEEEQSSLPCLWVASDKLLEVWKNRKLCCLHRENGGGISGQRSSTQNELEQAGGKWKPPDVSPGSSPPPNTTHSCWDIHYRF